MLVFDDKPEIIEVSRSQRINISSSSKGNQLKWVADNKFIKLNTYTRYEDISEVLVSHLLSFTNIKSYLKYYHCIIVEDDVKLGDGCYSYNYLSAEQRDISFYRLFKRNGFDIGRMSYDEVRETLHDITGVDCKELCEILWVDHFDAEAICRKTHGKCFGDFNWIKFEGENIKFLRTQDSTVVLEKDGKEV